MKSAASARLVLVTVANEEQGATLAHALVEERLAACVNLIGPVRSIYRWKEKVEDDRECLLVIKARASLLRALERRIRELHTYEVPEMLAVKIDRGFEPYLAWLMESTSRMPSTARRRKR